MTVYPLVFEPLLKQRLWGGRRLAALGKTLPSDVPIGESWEVVDLETDQSVVRAGPARGRTLHSLVAEWGRDLVGDAGLEDGRFPLLIKFLDAAETLSVQVHPDRAMAERIGRGARPKSEAWYIIEAKPGGAIYHGLADGADREAFAAAVRSGRVVEMLRRIPVRLGECYDLPAGTVHALGAGVLVAEVQTPSDTTYRLYDWDRVDPRTGRPRELHVEEGLACMRDPPSPPRQERSHVASVWASVSRLLACEAFVIERVRMIEGFEQEIQSGALVVWIVLEGNGRIRHPAEREPLAFAVGDVVVLPAALKGARVEIVRDSLWLEVTVPQGSNPMTVPHTQPFAIRTDPNELVQLRPPAGASAAPRRGGLKHTGETHLGS